VDFLLQNYQVQEKNLVWLQTFPLLQKIMLVGEEWSQIDDELFYLEIQNIRERYQNMMTGSDIVPLFQTLL
jgi:ABC-type enterochelin transport system ATPase subunit